MTTQAILGMRDDTLKEKKSTNVDKLEKQIEEGI